MAARVEIVENMRGDGGLEAAEKAEEHAFLVASGSRVTGQAPRLRLNSTGKRFAHRSIASVWEHYVVLAGKQFSW
jgi:hypothetical protein